jgi:hypothetical protein
VDATAGRQQPNGDLQLCLEARGVEAQVLDRVAAEPVVRSRTDVRSSTRMTVFASREIATRQPGTPLIPPPAT